MNWNDMGFSETGAWSCLALLAVGWLCWLVRWTVRYLQWRRTALPIPTPQSVRSFEPECEGRVWEGRQYWEPWRANRRAQDVYNDSECMLLRRQAE